MSIRLYIALGMLVFTIGLFFYGKHLGYQDCKNDQLATKVTLSQKTIGSLVKIDQSYEPLFEEIRREPSTSSCAPPRAIRLVFERLRQSKH